MSAKEKDKIDSKVGTTNNDNDFVKFKVHEYNQSHHEKVSYVDIYNGLGNDSLSFLYASRCKFANFAERIFTNEVKLEVS